MSLLERMRQSTESTSTRLIVGAIAVVFIFWNVGNNDRLSSGAVATVNGEEIPMADLRDAARRVAGQGDLSDAQREEIVNDLIARVVMRQEAERMGLQVGDAEVAGRIRTAFSQFVQDGKFDRKAYEAFLKARRLTHEQIVDDVREGLLLERLLFFVSQGVDVSEVEARKLWEKQATRFDVSYVLVGASNFHDRVTVSDSERASWIAAHADAIQKRYDERLERSYNLPRRYALSTILLRSDLPGADEAALRKRLEDLKQQIEGGADFAELARTWSEDLTAANAGDLGVQAQAQLDAEVVKAVDAAGAGAVTAVVKSQRGLELLKVREILPARVVPLEEVRDAIATELIQEERAPALADAFLGRLREGWTSEAPPAELLDEGKLSLETTGPWSLAQAEAGELPQLGNVPGLLDAAKSAAPGSLLPGTWEVRGRRAIVRLVDRQEADPASWETFRPLVTGQLRMRARTAHVEQWQQSLVAGAVVKRPAR